VLGPHERQLADVRKIRASRSGRWIGLLSREGVLAIHDTESGRWRAEISGVVSWAFSSDEERVVLVGQGGALRHHTVESGARVDAPALPFPGFTPDLADVFASPTDDTLLLVDCALAAHLVRDGEAHALDLELDHTRITSDLKSGVQPTACFRRDGRRVAVLAPDGAVSIFDTVTGARRTRIVGDDFVSSMAFTADGRLVCGMRHGDIVVHERDGAEVLDARTCHPDIVTALVVSAKGLVISASIDTRLRSFTIGERGPFEVVDVQGGIARAFALDSVPIMLQEAPAPALPMAFDA